MTTDIKPSVYRASRLTSFRNQLLMASMLALTGMAIPVQARVEVSANQRPQTDAEIRSRADALISQMTNEEKAAQITSTFNLPNPQMQKMAEKKVREGAGSLLFVSDPVVANRLQKMALTESRMKIPLLFGFDVIHGLSTIFPVPIGAAASWDPLLVERSQAVAAKESRAVGIHWTFAPMVDIARDARWGRIVEGSGEDPFLGSAMAAAQVRGFQGSAIGQPDHIISGPKHFVGYGAVLGGRDYDEVNMSDYELRNVYLPPFKAAIDAGAGNIMSSYMGINGIPTSGSKLLLTDILRKELGFNGWVVSDNEAVNNLKTHGFAKSAQDAAAKALNAGLDMEMNLISASFSNLPKAVTSGEVTVEQLDNAVRRVLEAKIRMGLFEHPYVDEARAKKILRAPASLLAAEQAAERSAVLLRNTGSILPLDRSKLKSIAVIGSLADSPRDTVGSWVVGQNNPVTESILAGLRGKIGSGIQITYSPGVAIPERLNPSPFGGLDGSFVRPAPKDDASGIASAVDAAKNSDVAIVVVGEGLEMSGESASRSSLDLPGRQQELLNAVVATGKPVIVVLMNGRPLDLKDTKAAAILEMWYPGSRGGTATANLIFGDAVPGGKLPITWPRNAAQLPMFYSHLTSHEPGKVNKRYWNESSAPVYPFGYGLSYSTFSYSAPRLDRAKIGPNETIIVSVDLKNTGTRTADEVAQLYIHQRYGTAARPVRELKGFNRVTLKAGEARTLTFKVDQSALRYWNSEARDWVVDDAEFDIAVGGDSTATFGGRFTFQKAP